MNNSNYSIYTDNIILNIPVHTLHTPHRTHHILYILVKTPHQYIRLDTICFYIYESYYVSFGCDINYIGVSIQWLSENKVTNIVHDFI